MIWIESPLNYRELYNFLQIKLISGKVNYIFSDEVRRAPQFGKVMGSLCPKDDAGIYLPPIERCLKTPFFRNLIRNAGGFPKEGKLGAGLR